MGMQREFNFVFLIKITYTQKPPSIRTVENKEEIFCVIRKRWFRITPEEWVRQNFLLHLIHDLKFQPSLIAVEKQLQVGEMKKRFDIVVYSASHKPYLIIECKEMNVPLTEEVLQQALRYNIPVNAPFVVITNGAYCMAFRIENGNFVEADQLPSRA